MESTEQNSNVMVDNEPHVNNSRKSANIKINTLVIPRIADDEQENELRCLGITAYHQSVYEEGVMRQVDSAMSVTVTDNGKQDSNQIIKHIFESNNSANGDRDVALEEPTDFRKSCDTHQISSTNINANNQLNTGLFLNSSNSFSCDKNFDNLEISTKYKYNKRVICETDSDDDSDDREHTINRRVNSNDKDDDEWLPTDGDDYDDNEDNEYISDHQIEFDGIVTNGDTDDEQIGAQSSKKKKQNKLFAKRTVQPKRVNHKIIDDGNEKNYQKRIKEYKKQRVLEMHQNILPNGTEIKNLDEFIELDHGYRIPKKIWDQLFAYQQTGVRWLWELHRNGCGGIVGDEMGLGKTIQMIAFLCGLMCSKIHDFRDLFTSLGPVILVCPATIMHQWVAEFHKWWPYFRVAILHQTGSYTGSREVLIRNINRANGILITSYSSIYKYQKILGKFDWHYVILDEGHKIRNPDAQITLACKMFNTPHRLILSGSPIQNNLRELWSLFDFIYPGKLGTLQIFMEHFAVPITQGGYANATQVQIQVAYKCASVLRDAIKPYLLRRMKDEVKSSLVLPSKNEQVLFCKLTDEQRQIYKSYLDSSAVKDIMRGSTQIFVGLINLRKICNHPHLFNVSSVKNELCSKDDDELFGYYKKSGKMIVVDALLRLWFSQSHKVLLFSQSRQMLKIMENFVKYRKYRYLIMDGTTAVQLRQSAIKQFNEDKDIFIFLLTTRVGGIGVNLTGANRVLIYDPDWNPSTDVQARERCWRIGQNRNVTIYRLLSAGTVEEKIYHRQIFKQYLTNRVLKDPKQRRFFKTNDLHELFTLASESDNTESSAIFAGTDSEVKVNHKAKKPIPQEIQENCASQTYLPPEKIAELRERAKKLSEMIAKKFANESNCVQNNSLQNNKNNRIFENKSVAINHVSVSSEVDKNKCKKPKKGLKFEGKRIKYLLKQDQYKESTVKSVNNNEDDYVLKKLFKRSKVHSALQHDNIECTSTPDFALAEKEAEMVAKQAINALKRSRESCSQTWTPLASLSKSNKFGQMRKINAVSENEPSSSSLLRDIKSRNKFDIETNDSVENGSNDTLNGNVNTDCDQLLADIRNFIAFQSQCNGEATTEQVLHAFKAKLQPHQSAVFKSLLYQLCEFYRRSDKVGVWRLKSEFR